MSESRKSAWQFWASAVVLASAAMAQTVFYPAPARVVGHTTLTPRSGSPNLVEGRELYSPQSAALDPSVSPPALYVADTLNNRVLGWRNAAQFGNGAYADLVIGQVDRVSTLAGTSRTALNLPVALAVDAQGNLYVADAGNNRILRFPRPFQQLDQGRTPIEADLVIGQTDFSSNRANRGGSPAAETVALVGAAGTFRSGLVFDGAGNLWFADAANSRVLRYPADALRQGAPGPAADLVLGQENFTSATALAETAANRVVKNRMRYPSGLAFDPAGRLYVADGLSRVLVFAPPFTSSMAAARLMGIVVVPAGQQPPPAVNDTGLNRPEAVFMIGPNPAVVDTNSHRILLFPRFEEWPAETSARISPAAQAVIGQPDMSTARAAAGAAGLNTPVHAIFSGSELFIVDSGNHRVVVWPQQPDGRFIGASRVLGQISLDFSAANLIEGRELFLTGTAIGAYSGTVALDTTSSPPRLYIADTFNNRILGYRDAFRVKPGDFADLVIGQPDRFRSTINHPSGDARITTRSSLFWPTGIAVDAAGNLWVADSGNNRVLRFPRPSFDAPQVMPEANLVLGQADFFTTARSTDPTRRTMALPYGLAFTPEGHLVVSDAAHHRVLLFRKPEGGDFTNGMDAAAVIGQPDFTSAASGTAENRFNSPRGIAVDTSGRLYVADVGNNRVSIFSNVAAVTPGSDPRPAVVLVNSTGTARLRSPYGVAVNQTTGEIWVAELGASRLLRYPEYGFLPAANYAANLALTVNAPLTLTLDSFGNPVVAEAINRVAMYYPAVAGLNAANYIVDRPVAPGTYVALYPAGGPFAFSETRVFDQEPNPIPMPKRLADIEVLINDEPVPLHFVSPGQINFLMPMNAPSSGSVSVLVQRPSTGQILGYGRIDMAPASPGLFTSDSSGSGQLAALNQDNTRNGPGNAAARGSVIQLFATGTGFIPGAPPDGDTPGGRQILTPEKPRVFIGTDFVPDSDVLYSGLAPGLIGVWQINVRIPDRVAPGNAVLVYVQYRDIPSMTPARRGTIAVR